MPAPPTSFLMLRIPLLISGLVYFALAVFIPKLLSADGTGDGDFIGTQIAVVCIIMGAAAIVLAFVCHRPDEWMFWVLFGTTLLYVPSLFIFLGIPMLVFLLRKEVQDHYGVQFSKRK